MRRETLLLTARSPAPYARRSMSRARRSTHARYVPAGPDGIGRLELTRPEKLNATDDDSVRDLDRAATTARRDARARTVIVSGQGRAFCTGIDLSALSGDRLRADWFRRWDVSLAKIEAIPVATVTAIQGPCLGGGLQIALCCDLRVASTEATFGLSAVRHGIVPGLATYRLPRLVGLAAAQELMLLGETWNAARAHAQGLVHRVVPLRRLDAAATELARTLAANVRAATVATKRLTLRSYDLPLGRFLREYVRDQRACWADAETKSTLARYRAGRWGKADSRITDRRK
jgi:enoyl-CoA hydratase/carnithine racemase